MIADFLEVHKLDGKVHTFPSDTTLEKAAQQAHVGIGSIAQTLVFADDKMDLFVIVAVDGEKVTSKDAEKLFAWKGLSVPQAKEVLLMTGFSSDAFPPLAVFGAQVQLTKSAKEKKNLLFALSAREYLVITTKDLLRAAELGNEFS